MSTPISTSLTVRLPADLRGRIVHVANSTRRSTSSVVKQALEAGLPAIEETTNSTLLLVMDDIDVHQVLRDSYADLLGIYASRWREARHAGDEERAQAWGARATELRADRDKMPEGRDAMILKITSLRARQRELTDMLLA